MKSYPSISKIIKNNIYTYLFSKIDGSNIRAEWNNKRGFYKFGTRHQLIDQQSQPFDQAISLLKNKYKEDLSKVFNQQGWKDAICFFEYWGNNSFAGNHDFTQSMDITLIDVNPYKKGILLPNDFIKYFGHLDTPSCCYQGFISDEIVDQVKQSTLPGMAFERVVAKGSDNGQLVMFKIKNQALVK